MSTIEEPTSPTDDEMAAFMRIVETLGSVSQSVARLHVLRSNLGADAVLQVSVVFASGGQAHVAIPDREQ